MQTPTSKQTSLYIHWVKSYYKCLVMRFNYIMYCRLMKWNKIFKQFLHSSIVHKINFSTEWDLRINIFRFGSVGWTMSIIVDYTMWAFWVIWWSNTLQVIKSKRAWIDLMINLIRTDISFNYFNVFNTKNDSLLLIFTFVLGNGKNKYRNSHWLNVLDYT